SLTSFMDGFELPDNELHFNAVVNYDQLDTSKFGSVGTLDLAPNTSLTNSLIPTTVKPSIASIIGQNGDNSALIKQQEQQIGLLQQQLGLLSNISNKDNSVYLDGKQLYNS